jgi:excisionase family DNA binding protein
MNNEIFKDYPDVVTPEDVQNMLHIGRNRVYELLKTNAIKSIKVGKKYIIPKKSVINFLQLAV